MTNWIYHAVWQPYRMVITLPEGMRLGDKIVAYDAAMTANDAIQKMLDSK